MVLRVCSIFDLVSDNGHLDRNILDR